MATEEEIKNLLLRNPKAVDRAIVVLFNRQTHTEQQAGHTSESNGRGFNAFDAERGTYWAKWILSGRNLSGTHLEKARRMSLKYVRQLKEAADLKASHPSSAGSEDMKNPSKQFICSDCGFDYPKSEKVTHRKIVDGKVIDEPCCERCSSVRDSRAGIWNGKA